MSFLLLFIFSVPLSPAIITDLSHNGTYVNGVKIGKGNSHVLDDKDEIGITHELVKSMFILYNNKLQYTEFMISIATITLIILKQL